MSFPDLALGPAPTLLCDADGTLFPSEEPAFEASVAVTNAVLAAVGVPRRYAAEELRRSATGTSFRAGLSNLVASHGVDVTSPAFAAHLDGWVAEEDEVVTAHLAEVLQPDPGVQGPLRELAETFPLALVTSSTLERIDASLRSSGLSDLFPQERRFSAQDSLPTPTSKPDPAVYLLAVRRLGLQPGTALAVEDAVAGAQSAVAAGLPTVGMLCFVPPAERSQRIEDLQRVGVDALVDSWAELAALLLRSRAHSQAAGGRRKQGTP